MNANHLNTIQFQNPAFKRGDKETKCHQALYTKCYLLLTFTSCNRDGMMDLVTCLVTKLLFIEETW